MKRADNPSERGEKIKTERVGYAKVLWHKGEPEESKKKEQEERKP